MKTFRAVILNPIAPAKTTGALWFKPDDRGVITIYHWVGGNWVPLYVNVDITQEDYDRMRDAVIAALESEYDTAEEIAEKYVSKAGDTIIGTIFFKNTIEVDKPADFKSIINALGGINANGQHISNLASPIHDTDAATKEYVDRKLATKQSTLISGTNIKTINNESLLGSGNIDIKDIFIATYNVTPFDDVYAAFNSGKAVLCKYGTTVYRATNDEGGEIWFDAMRSGMYVTISKVWVDYNNIWRSDNARHIMTSEETESEINVAMSAKQDTLISGTNIKTVNNNSLLGNGNIAIDSDMAASSDKSSYIKNKVGGYKIYVPNDDITLNFGGRWLDGDSPITKTFDQLLELGCPQSVIDTIKAKRVSVGFYGEGIFLGEAYYDWEEYPEGICFLPTEGDEVEFTYIDIHNTADGEDGGGTYTIIPLPSSYVPSKQDKLVSGTNIKTINGESVLGAGDIVIEPGKEPDNEDITIDSNNRLKFADRAVATDQKGYVILRKNKTFAEQVTDENTIYEIRYDFDLGGNPVIIPAGCELRFVGGVIKNGQVVLNGTTLSGEKFIGDGIALSGTLFNKEVSFDWWAYDLNASCTPMMQSAIGLAAENGKKLYISDGEYLLTISNDSGYRYCLYSEKHVSIRGESRDGTILKTVKTDLSDPDFDTDATDSYGYHYSTEYGCAIRISAKEDNAGIVLESLTLDGGNSQYKSSNRNVGHKAVWMSRTSPNNITKIHVTNVRVTNFEGEGLYNSGYEGLGYDSDYVITDCIFANNGGSSGNVGGSAIYRNCAFDNANIEHTFGGGNYYGRLIVDGCTFRNRDGALSCDKQRTVSTWDSIKGCQCFIKNCIFENTITDTTGFNKIIAVSILETENVMLENNFFHNAGYRYSQGGCALNIGNYVYNLVSSGNVFVSDISPFQNCNIVASTCRSNIYKDNVCCIFGGAASGVLDICDRLILDVAQTENSVNYCGLGSRVWTLHVSVDNRNSVNKTISYFNVQNYYTGGPVVMTANSITAVRNVTSNMASIVIQAPFASLTIDNPIHVLLNGRLNEDFIPSGQKATGRPTKLAATDTGFIFFDANLGKCIVWNGTAWVNMDGTALS